MTPIKLGKSKLLASLYYKSIIFNRLNLNKNSDWNTEFFKEREEAFLWLNLKNG